MIGRLSWPAVCALLAFITVLILEILGVDLQATMPVAVTGVGFAVLALRDR